MIRTQGAPSSSRAGGLTPAELRTAALLFNAELEQGLVDLPALRSSSAVRAAVRVRDIPARPARLVQQALFKLGLLSWERTALRPLACARQAVLGERAAPPRFLVRVDEFPHYRAWEQSSELGAEAYERFHAVLRSAGLPYLLAVLPRVSDRPLDPRADASRPLSERELALLRRIAGEGVCLGLHGRDHRTRFASPRRHSELCGLDAKATERLLADGLAQLAEHGVSTDVFVAPYNRFDAAQLPVLARHFTVVCGGPESIGALGFHPAPQWRGEVVYLPSYPPFYGTAAQMLRAAQAAIDRGIGLWVPLVLHWEWEARDRWRSLSRLAELIAPHAASWSEFLSAVKRSRGKDG